MSWLRAPRPGAEVRRAQRCGSRPVRAGVAWLGLLALATAWSGSTSGPPTQQTPPAAGPVAPTPESPAQAVQPERGVLQINAGQAVPIQLRYTTVGPLHQGFFGRESLVARLGSSLGACTDHTVEVDVVWSQKDLEGRIIGQIPTGTSVCVPRAAGADRIDLTPLVPATRALADYRDRVAGFSDFRIANFVVAADVLDEGIICRFRAAGQHPPDGTRFDPCVEVNGERICARGSASDGVDTLVFDDPADARRVLRCL